jgi:hypothetical protein
MSDELKAMIEESRTGAEGRPSVYLRPLLPQPGQSTRYDYLYRDRLLLALRREHGEPRYDLQPGVS